MVFLNCNVNDSMSLIINGDTNIEIKKVVDLTSSLKETSGLINFNGRLITHNDSGGGAYLYEIDINTGDVSRRVEILNVINIDFEDLAQDDNYIYVGDIGNNSNQRKDLVIYKISKSDYINNTEVTAETIKISYKEQIDFSKSKNSANFDSEAIVIIENDLFLFTKNWGNLKTSVYKIPKSEGTYELEAIDSYDIDGLITGADYNKNNRTLVLTGYQNFMPFIVKLNDFSAFNPLDGKVEKKSIRVSGSIQIEAIAANPDGSYYLSAENSGGLPAILYELKFN